MGRYVTKLNTTKDRADAIALISKSPDGTRLEFSRNIRSLDQNDRLWAMLTEVSKKATHHGQQYSADDWKVLFMTAMQKEMRIAPALNGNGVALLGTKSSKLTVPECSDLMEFISAWSAENKIELADPRFGAAA